MSSQQLDSSVPLIRSQPLAYTLASDAELPLNCALRPLLQPGRVSSERDQTIAPHPSRADLPANLFEHLAFAAGKIDRERAANFVRGLPSVSGNSVAEACTRYLLQRGEAEPPHPLATHPNGFPMGFSGAELFMVAGMDSRILKVIPKREDFLRETAALQWAESRHFSNFSVPRILDLHTITLYGREDSPMPMLVMSKINGRSLEQLMCDLGDSAGSSQIKAYAQLDAAVTSVARSLAELHSATRGSRPVHDHYNRKHSETLVDMARELEEMHPVLDAFGLDAHAACRRIVEIADILGEEIPGPSVVHGDANLGNFLFGGEGTRAIIDLAHLPLSLDGDLEPIGDPARDVANFYQKLLHSAARNGVPNRDALALGASFLQTYEQEEGIPLRPAAFQFARARTALGEFLRACHTVDEPALIEQHLELVSSVLWERTL